MNKFIVIPVILGIVAVILISSMSINKTPDTTSIYESGFTYYDIEKIQDTLAEKNIVVSAPTPITDHTISQYCAYFENGLPMTVEYCTTTAVLDSEETTLGNINIGGSIQSPVMAVANLETKTLESNQDDVVAIFETMIETLVCDCWEDEESKDYESISAWILAAQKFYSDSNGRNIKSKIDNLSNSEIFLEITSKENSVLQTLIILK
ncbi:hypothetical protein [Candidatus Nitrosopumilus sediminis]|uniref:Uncharacterized protein n=1 Tax=Candidatus Nitrosopumilus sediminis TaxID=1229909 RepID=K0BFF7_9ARCH|nr:hypothetical protein [Candidatus Nitrosopumilus sediminis]AFS83031.1 hypothetical protein NSED_06145 [Candidatus Nitrosopumilus sediminis]